ncbi:hypothetical protein O1L55_10820 [Streptomyces albulus]|nr:hypothetical protein [Streptomyces noursei]
MEGGAGLALGLERIAAGLAARRDQGEELRAQLAGPRATALVLALLPVGGLLMGGALGADPLGCCCTPRPGGALWSSAGYWSGAEWRGRPGSSPRRRGCGDEREVGVVSPEVVHRVGMAVLAVATVLCAGHWRGGYGPSRPCGGACRWCWKGGEGAARRPGGRKRASAVERPGRWRGRPAAREDDRRAGRLREWGGPWRRPEGRLSSWVASPGCCWGWWWAGARTAGCGGSGPRRPAGPRRRGWPPNSPRRRSAGGLSDGRRRATEAAEAVGRLLDGTVAERLRHIAAELRLGGEPAAMWPRLAELPGAEALARCLERAGTSGAPAVEPVSRIAAELRAEWGRAAAARARRAGFGHPPALGCFLPAFLVLGVAPVLIGLAGGLLGGDGVG